MESPSKLSEELVRSNPELWLWCVNCGQSFQAAGLRVDFLGEREQCAFCDGVGLGVDIFVWAPCQRSGRGHPRGALDRVVGGVL
jgi:hypothetical protein